MYRRSFLCTLAVAGALTLAPAAHAAGWAGSPPLSPAGHVALGVHVALLPDGSRVVAWIDRLPDRTTTENVSVRVAPPTGDFGPVQTFAGDARDLRLVSGDDGTAALAWATRDERIHVARRAPGESAFTEATPLLVSEGQSELDLDAAVAGGTVYVAYDSSKTLLQQTKTSIHAARLTPGDTALRELVGTDGGLVARETYTFPAPARSVNSPHLTVNSDGTLAVAYEHRGDSTGAGHGITSIVAALRPADSPSFGLTVSLKNLEGSSTFAPGADLTTASGGGHRYVVWDSGFRTPIAFSDLDGGFTPAALPADPATSLAAGADGTGTLQVSSTGLPSPDAFQDVVDASATRAGAQPDAARRITPLGLDRRIDDFVVASDGTALAVANLDTFGSRSDPQALLRPAGGDFGPPEHVAGLQDVPDFDSEPASAAVAPGGRAIVGWVAAENTGAVNARVHVSERDTTPPGFGAIEAPDSAVVGQPAGFAAAASDTLSGTTLHWDFGDGSEADGNVVSHTFGEPGPATVTITATDEAGNSTSTSRVVAVTAAPAPPDTGGGGGGGPTTPPPDTIAPVLSAAKFTNPSFRVAGKSTAVVARAAKAKRSPAGTTLRVNLSERSTVVVAIARAKIVRGTLVRASVAPGAVAIPFSGRLGKTALPAGSYTATITAIDGAGNRSKAVIVKFKIVKK